jgi:hypothetical protein
MHRCFGVCQLEYLSTFLKETLRMRPPVGNTTGRTVIKDEGVVMGGYIIPKGVSVAPSIWSAHYDAKYAVLRLSTPPPRRESSCTNGVGANAPPSRSLAGSGQIRSPSSLNALPREEKVAAKIS